MSNRVQKEQEFHDHRFGGIDPRTTTQKFYAVKKHVNAFFYDAVFKNCEGKKLLEYGCGAGNSSLAYLHNGAQLTGIDISVEGIERAKETVSEHGFDAKYLVMNAEEMTFENNSFDICVGSGILHHLDMDKSISEISRVLKKEGSAYFIEPMGHNPIINWYRNRTPSMRTDDEHPLLIKDIENLNKYFITVNVNYFALSTLAAVPFFNTKSFNAIYSGLQKLDSLLLKSKFIGKHAWTAVIELSDPIRQPN